MEKKQKADENLYEGCMTRQGLVIVTRAMSKIYGDSPPVVLEKELLEKLQVNVQPVLCADNEIFDTVTVPEMTIIVNHIDQSTGSRKTGIKRKLAPPPPPPPELVPEPAPLEAARGPPEPNVNAMLRVPLTTSAPVPVVRLLPETHSKFFPAPPPVAPPPVKTPKRSCVTQSRMSVIYFIQGMTIGELRETPEAYPKKREQLLTCEDDDMCICKVGYSEHHYRRMGQHDLGDFKDTLVGEVLSWPVAPTLLRLAEVEARKIITNHRGVRFESTLDWYLIPADILGTLRDLLMAGMADIYVTHDPRHQIKVLRQEMDSARIAAVRDAAHARQIATLTLEHTQEVTQLRARVSFMETCIEQATKLGILTGRLEERTAECEFLRARVITRESL